jgi:DAACS family dicarboxylate/amino acid:cation (Na+ or H+) symporter
VLIVALLLGLALRGMPDDEAAPVRRGLQALHDLCARGIGLVMRLAPLGVGAMMCALVARSGLAGVLPLARFVGVVLLAMGLQVVLVYATALRLAGARPLEVLRGARPALAMAFATSSSAATLPTTLQVAEEGLALPAEQSRFVLTVGATGNQNGTALFEGVTVLFLAQLYGVELGIPQQAVVVGVSLLAGVGTAGVPGGSLPVIAAICAGVGVPPEGVGVLVGVDRLLDMCRTTLNVAGDLVIAVIVGRRAEA